MALCVHTLLSTAAILDLDTASPQLQFVWRCPTIGGRLVGFRPGRLAESLAMRGNGTLLCLVLSQISSRFSTTAHHLRAVVHTRVKWRDESWAVSSISPLSRASPTWRAPGVASASGARRPTIDRPASGRSSVASPLVRSSVLRVGFAKQIKRVQDDRRVYHPHHTLPLPGSARPPSRDSRRFSSTLGGLHLHQPRRHRGAPASGCHHGGYLPSCCPSDYLYRPGDTSQYCSHSPSFGVGVSQGLARRQHRRT